MSRKIARSGLLLLASFLVASSSNASIVTTLRLEDVVSRSDLIVVGKALDFHTYKSDLQDYDTVTGLPFLHKDKILTDWRVEVLQTLKGTVEGANVNVTAFGGEIDGVIRWCTLCYALEPGEIFLFFLTWNQQNKKWLSLDYSLTIFKIRDYGEKNSLVPIGEAVVLLEPEAVGLKRTGALLNATTLGDVLSEVANQ